MAALSSIYPAPNYAATTGTLKGRIVAKDGTSQLTGINVIARRIDQGNPFDAMSRISGDLTQGYQGPDGNFTMTGLVAGRELRRLHRRAWRRWLQHAEGDPARTRGVLEFGRVRRRDGGQRVRIDADHARGWARCARSTIAVNGIQRAPTFTHISYGLVSNVSDNGQRIVGVYGTFQSPFWLWDKTDGQTYLGGGDSSARSPATAAWSAARSASTWKRLTARPFSSTLRCGPRKAAGSRSRTTSSRAATISTRPSSTCPVTDRPPSASLSSTARMPTRSSGPRSPA